MGVGEMHSIYHFLNDEVEIYVFVCLCVFKSLNMPPFDKQTLTITTSKQKSNCVVFVIIVHEGYQL